MSKSKSTEANVPSVQFPVVGIGASAGGLEAIKQFLQAIPEKSGMAYVFVQHLSPAHESALPEILKNFSRIPVRQIADNMQLEQDNFYIIPSNRIVKAEDGVLKLDTLDEKHHKVKVIDLFFSSLAVVHQSFAVGVILSGTLNDGALGLQVIKSHGGITFAQDEHSAAFAEMPKNAVKTGAVDFIFPPAEIIGHLISINHPFHTGYSKKQVADALPQHDEETFKQLLTVLRVRRGVDFSYYKPATLKRRIIRRMALNKIAKPEEYLIYLRENKAEQDALYNDMLISVTNFFRDPGSFELLCGTIFPAIIKNKLGSEPLRIWVAGCATGEEAYSMAICLQEQLGDRTAAMKIQIFASDISEMAITKARSGMYRATDLEGLSPSRVQQFFTKLDGTYQVNKVIRDMCVFAHHNLLKDPPFSKIDLVSCRNVLIYLEPVLQKRALTTFHYALNAPGYLMLGKAESIGSHTDLFSPYNSHEKIFSRKGERGPFMAVTSPLGEQSFREIDKDVQKENGGQDVFKIAGETILSKYAPACVLVNERFDIIQFYGKTDPWLTLIPGRASFNLLKMAREGLAFELRSLLHITKKKNEPARKENVLFKVDGRDEYVTIEAALLLHVADPHYLVVFQKTADPGIIPAGKLAGKSKKLPDPRDLEIEQLKKEMMQDRSEMRAVTEEQEAVNEELQSANEELLSSSEELQSVNEELETSKEELQSTNEEIIIVNNELVDRNEQLNHARSYTEGIINTIRDPLIILNSDLKVLRATNGFYQKFKVSEEQTEGQYFYELGDAEWNIPALKQLLENLLSEEKMLTDFEVTHVFPNIGRKTMLLNARQLNSISGGPVILLAIEDVTDQRKVEEGLTKAELLLKESKDRLKLAVDAAQLGTWDRDLLSGELIFDSRCKALFGVPLSDSMEYAKYLALIHPGDRKEVEQSLMHAIARVNDGKYDQEFRLTRTKDQKPVWIRSKGQVYFDEQNVAARFVGTSLDITPQKLAEEMTNELLKKKDDFMSIASHELKTPITTLKASLQLLERVKDDPAPQNLPSLIGRANRSMEKINTLIGDLLNVSKISKGQLELNKTRFTMSELIAGCCDYVEATGTFKIMISGDMTTEIYADAERIEQVIVNFVNNAMKYAPKSKEININIKKTDDLVKVTVTDKGPGIPPEKRPHLFERYYQAERNGGQYFGLGLGLYICAEIIKKHDGDIGVESEPGKGSTFWFTLPCST